MEVQDLITYLDDLTAGLKAGNIVVKQGDKSLNLTPPQMIEVEIKAKQKKNKDKFSMELSWPTSEIVETPAKLEISDQPVSQEAE
jgi:amphi-Trp domain-containing protein